jgi:hypothetical protein
MANRTGPLIYRGEPGESWNFSHSPDTPVEGVTTPTRNHDMKFSTSYELCTDRMLPYNASGERRRLCPRAGRRVTKYKSCMNKLVYSCGLGHE